MMVSAEEAGLLRIPSYLVFVSFMLPLNNKESIPTSLFPAGSYCVLLRCVDPERWVTSRPRRPG